MKERDVAAFESLELHLKPWDNRVIHVLELFAGLGGESTALKAWCKAVNDTFQMNVGAITAAACEKEVLCYTLNAKTHTHTISQQMLISDRIDHFNLAALWGQTMWGKILCDFR